MSEVWFRHNHKFMMVSWQVLIMQLVGFIFSRWRWQVAAAAWKKSSFKLPYICSASSSLFHEPPKHSIICFRRPFSGFSQRFLWWTLLLRVESVTADTMVIILLSPVQPLDPNRYQSSHMPIVLHHCVILPACLQILSRVILPASSEFLLPLSLSIGWYFCSTSLCMSSILHPTTNYTLYIEIQSWKPW